MIRTVTKRRHALPSPHRPTPWQIFRRSYEAEVVASWSRLDAAIWRNVADDCERLFAPRELGDISIDRLAAMLRHDGCDGASVAIYLEMVEAARDWAGNGARTKGAQLQECQ